MINDIFKNYNETVNNIYSNYLLLYLLLDDVTILVVVDSPSTSFFLLFSEIFLKISCFFSSMILLCSDISANLSIITNLNKKAFLKSLYTTFRSIVIFLFSKQKKYYVEMFLFCLFHQEKHCKMTPELAKSQVRGLRNHA